MTEKAALGPYAGAANDRTYDLARERIRLRDYGAWRMKISIPDDYFDTVRAP
jgi:hypothetical protein